ncbi:MAG: tetratricopeptide repeat protein [Elusimicrobiota bacterium]
MKSGKTGNRINKARSAFLTRLLAALILVFTCICSATSLYAEGGKPGAVFDFGAGARPLAMGGSYSAVSKDGSAVYYNPAGLGLMSGRNVLLMHAMLYEGATYDYFSYAQNFGKLPGAWGGQVLRMNVGEIDGRDEFNRKTSVISYTETAFALGAGLSGIFYPGVSAGFTGKVLNRSLAGDSDNLIGFDAGLHYGPLYGEKLDLSFVAQNLLAFATGDTSDRLPFAVKAGASYLVAGNILLSADVSSDRVVRVGTEYVMGPVAFRAGYGSGTMSLGAGVKFLKAYSFDLATVKNEDLGVSNRFSLGYLFGATAAARQPRPRTYAKDYLAQAEADLNSAAFLNAYDNISMALGLDSSIKKDGWGEKHLRLGELIESLKLREIPEREANLKASTPAAKEAVLAVRGYLNGQTVKSMLLAQSAAGYDPNNAFYAELLRVMSVVNSRPTVQDEILPRPLLVNLKLEKAASAFYIKDFKRSIMQCSEVLTIDEGNADAWKKMGSAYFALGDLPNAKRSYQKVLELNPQDAGVIRFMTLQGWR